MRVQEDGGMDPMESQVGPSKREEGLEGIVFHMPLVDLMVEGRCSLQRQTVGSSTKA